MVAPSVGPAAIKEVVAAQPLRGGAGMPAAMTRAGCSPSWEGNSCVASSDLTADGVRCGMRHSARADDRPPV